MYRISKEFSFAASHQLTHLPADHPCARLHGHNYVIELELAGHEVDTDTGFIYDYRALDTFKARLDEAYDHRHLNDVLGDPRETTAERLALRLYRTAIDVLRLPPGATVTAVRVRETPKTQAEYRP